MTDDVAGGIRTFITQTFLYGNAHAMLPDDASLLEAGIIVSLDVIELIMFLDEEFGITIPHDAVLPENFDSVNTLTPLIQSKLAPAAV